MTIDSKSNFPFSFENSPILRWFALLRSMICAENSRHSLNQSDEKLKPITNRSPAFSRASGSLVVFTYCMTLTRIFLSSDRTVVVTTLLLVLRHSIEKRSK